MSLPDSYLLNIEAFRAETVRLPYKWVGPYLYLCLAIFQAGGAVANVPKDLARKARIDDRQFKVFWPLVKDLFLVSGAEIRHATATQKRQDWDNFVASRKKNGAKGGQKTQQKQRAAQARAGAMEEERRGQKDPLLRGPSVSPEAALGDVPEDFRLTAAAEDAFIKILSDPVLANLCNPSSLADVRAALVAFDGAAFEVASAPASQQDWFRICATVKRAGFDLRLSDQRVLHLDFYRDQKTGGEG